MAGAACYGRGEETRTVIPSRLARQSGPHCIPIRFSPSLTLATPGRATLKTMEITDYTLLPIGTKSEEGEIQKCPYCGKHGYAQTISGKMYYTHSESISQIVDADKSWKTEVKRESCPSR